MIYRSGVPFAVDIGHSTVVGGAHSAEGIPNQDAADADTVGHYFFGVVADGVGITSIPESSPRSNHALTAAGLAVEAFMRTASEVFGDASEGEQEAEPKWALRYCLAAANRAIRMAKEQGELPQKAATTFIGLAGSLVTGRIVALPLGDGEITKWDGDRPTNLAPGHTDRNGHLTKVIKGAPELRYSEFIDIPTPNSQQRLVASTDGLFNSYRLMQDLRHDLSDAEGYEEPSALLARALQLSPAQEAADALAHMATKTADGLFAGAGMRPSSDDTSAIVIDLYPVQQPAR